MRYNPGRNISEGKVDELVYRLAERHGKDFCIDIGSGQDKHEYFKTVDILEKFDTDYVGDIRCLFAPVYVDSIDKHPSLQNIKSNTFEVVKLQHVVEHIEWIYQEFLLRWVVDILAPGGLVYIGTPNLEYAVGVYVANRKRQVKKQDVKYPIGEHTYCKPGVSSDMQKWVNFKIFSGCSPGDYHHCMYDRYMLHAELEKAGLENISIYDGSVLKAVAYKPGMPHQDVNESIRRATQ